MSETTLRRFRPRSSVRAYRCDIARGVLAASVLILTHPHDLAPRSGFIELTKSLLQYKMSYMAKSSVSIRELQQNLKRVVARVERGETVEVTRRRRPVARLMPAKASRARAGWPDLQARTREVFGDRLINPGGVDAVIRGRGDR